MKLESIMQESVELMEQEFYNKKMYFSYSSLNKLIWNPQVFYQMYVLGMKEERVESHLVQGKIIHVLLLEEVLTAEAFNYWRFLQMKQDKTIIDADTLKFCQSAVEIIKTNQQVCNLLGMNTTEFDSKQVINEEQIQLDLGNKVYGLKGIIDNIVIDYDNKVIYINDIKTTSKDLKDFPESIEYYSYWMQAVIYMMLVTKEHIDLIQSGFTARFHFVVIDRAFQSYAFPVTEKTMNSWLDRFNAILEKAEWHYHNKNYELPYEFAQGLVVL